MSGRGQRGVWAAGLLLCHWLAAGWAAPWAVGAKGPPISTSPDHMAISGRFGGQVHITCPVQAEPEPIVEWYRDGERLTEYSHRHKLSGLSLFIKKLECDDQGTYVCRAINGFGVLEKIFILELDRSKRNGCQQVEDDDDGEEAGDADVGGAGPQPLIFQPKSVRHLLKPAGSQVSIKCRAAGKPSPTIRWFKDNVEIGRSGKKLTVRDTVVSSGRQADEEEEDDDDDVDGVRQTVRSALQVANLTGSDTANYTCRASNSYGTAEVTFHLEVVERQESRQPELHPHYPANSSFAAGQPASLSCKAKSAFPPTLHWLKRLPDASAPPDGHVDVAVDPSTTFNLDLTPNRTLVSGGARYLILPPPSVILVDGYYLSKLTFGQVNADTDAGGYVCLVINDVGFIYREVYLSVGDAASSAESGFTSRPDSTSTLTDSAMSQADSITTAVVIFVVIVGLSLMVAICLVWKKRSRHVKENLLSGVAATKSSTLAVRTASSGSGTLVAEAGSLVTGSLLTNYPAFRDGLEGKDASPGREAGGAAYGPMLNQTNGVAYYSNGRPPSRRNNPPRRSHRSPKGQRAHRHDLHKRRIPAASAGPQRGSRSSDDPSPRLPIAWEKRSARLARPSPASSFDNGSLLL